MLKVLSLRIFSGVFVSSLGGFHGVNITKIVVKKLHKLVENNLKALATILKGLNPPCY